MLPFQQISGGAGRVPQESEDLCLRGFFYQPEEAFDSFLSLIRWFVASVNHNIIMLVCPPRLFQKLFTLSPVLGIKKLSHLSHCQGSQHSRNIPKDLKCQTCDMKIVLSPELQISRWKIWMSKYRNIKV